MSCACLAGGCLSAVIDCTMLRHTAFTRQALLAISRSSARQETHGHTQCPHTCQFAPQHDTIYWSNARLKQKAKPKIHAEFRLQGCTRDLTGLVGLTGCLPGLRRTCTALVYTRVASPVSIWEVLRPTQLGTRFIARGTCSYRTVLTRNFANFARLAQTWPNSPN